MLASELASSDDKADSKVYRVHFYNDYFIPFPSSHHKTIQKGIATYTVLWIFHEAKSSKRAKRRADKQLELNVSMHERYKGKMFQYGQTGSKTNLVSANWAPLKQQSLFGVK